MRRGILLAWAVGLGIVTWRGIKKTHKPVSPGQYAAASGLYVLLALVAEWEPAAAIATLMAWGFDIAMLFQVLPQQVAGPKAAGTTQAKGTTTAGGRGLWVLGVRDWPRSAC